MEGNSSTIQTPKGGEESKLEDEKEFQLTKDKDIFEVKIGKEIEKKNIIIKASKISKIVDVFYENKFSFDELIKLDKTFRAYDELEEIFIVLITFFNDKKIIINEVKNDEMTLDLKLMLMTGKEKIVNIKLFKKEMKKESIIKELCKKINILEEENKNLKEELNELKKWKNENEEFIKYIKDKLEFKKKINSKIITKIDEFNFIEKIFKNNDNNLTNKKFNLRLLYRATRNGDSGSSFHNICDNIKDTITLVKTKTGLIFGGYTNETWNGNGIYKKDDKAFCFSINLKKRYNNKKTDRSIYCTNANGPCFGDALFWIYGNCLSSGGFMNDGLNNRYDNQNKENEINEGKGEFGVEEVEVFKIELE